MSVPSTHPSLRGFEPLSQAERILLQACAAGTIAKVSYRRPGTPRADVTIRAAFLAHLARAGNGSRLDGRRIEILGAWIRGRLNLVDDSVPVSLWLYRCTFDHTPLLDGARITGSVGLQACRLPGLRAESATIAGELALNSGTTIGGEVRLSRAVIGRDLDCTRLVLRDPDREALRKRRPLVLDGACIGGSVVFGDGFEADGEIRLVGARIAGDFTAGKICLGASVCDSGVRGVALNLDLARVAGSVKLSGGLSVAGTVRLKGARIEGDLDCSGAAFDTIGDAAWGVEAGLLLDRARIGGTLALRKLAMPLRAASLAGARAGALADDDTSWGERLMLDGFSFGRLVQGAPVDAAFRQAWLMRQAPAHLDDDFRPAPWRQAIRVLRRQGEDESARRLAILREEHLRRIGRVGRGLPRVWRAMSNVGHALFGWSAGYGHRPQRLVAMLALAWAASGLVYGVADRRGGIAPRHPAACEASSVGSCAAVQNQGFRPFVFSLDLLLPLVDLRQARRWTPVPAGPADASVGDDALAALAGALTWLEPLLGWLASLGLVVTLFGLADRDRRA